MQMKAIRITALGLGLGLSLSLALGGCVPFVPII